MRIFGIKKLPIRVFVQIFFFVLIALIAVNHRLAENGSGIPLLASASLHAICPFGGVVSIYQYLSVGSFVQRIHQSSFVLMFIVFGLAVFVGPAFCGWVCPFGTIQEWFSGLGRLIFGKKQNHFIPQKLDEGLRFGRYLVLAWVIYVTAYSGKLFFSDIDPYYALFNFWTGEVAITGLIVLAVVLLASIFVERPWCKYACPYGAVLGIFNWFSIFKIRRTEGSCKDCGLCSRECPMNIQVHELKVVRNHQCISCLECTSENVCPAADTVEFSAFRRK